MRIKITVRITAGHVRKLPVTLGKAGFPISPTTYSWLEKVN